MAKRTPRTVFDLDEVCVYVTRDESGRAVLLLSDRHTGDDIPILPAAHSDGEHLVYELLVRESMFEYLNFGTSRTDGYDLGSTTRHERGWQKEISNRSDTTGYDMRMIIDTTERVIDFSAETPTKVAEMFSTLARVSCPELSTYRFAQELAVRTVLARTLIEGQTLTFGEDVERILSVSQDIDPERMAIVVAVITDQRRHVFTHDETVSIWAGDLPALP